MSTRMSNSPSITRHRGDVRTDGRCPPGQDYFSDGLTEEMISQLGHLDPERLGVIARTSVMHYKHNQEQLDQIGRDLGVQYVLEGRIRRDSKKVRISAQLIQVKDQTHVWARQYES